MAWKLGDENGFSMPRGYGDAKSWGSHAANAGHKVDNTPAVGSVAWRSTDEHGHVAWVEAVSGDSVAVQQYDGYTGKWSRATMTKASFEGYIHFKDLTMSAFNAGPSIALSSNATLMVHHVARDGATSTRTKTLNGLGYSTSQTGSTSSWATGGTSDIAIDPTQAETAWVAATKDTGGGRGELYIFRISQSGSQNMGRLEAGGQTASWSLSAPPSIVVDSEGNVYIAAVQNDGGMYVVKRNGATGNTAATKIGNSAAWSKSGTVSLALGHDDAIWLAAVTKESMSEVRTYRGVPHLLSFNYYGKVGVDNWTVDAPPAIVADKDGGITVAAVKINGAAWSYHNKVGKPGEWVKINDDIGFAVLVYRRMSEYDS